jgi:hypothetical protein
MANCCHHMWARVERLKHHMKFNGDNTQKVIFVYVCTGIKQGICYIHITRYQIHSCQPFHKTSLSNALARLGINPSIHVQKNYYLSKLLPLLSNKSSGIHFNLVVCRKQYSRLPLDLHTGE